MLRTQRVRSAQRGLVDIVKPARFDRVVTNRNHCIYVEVERRRRVNRRCEIVGIVYPERHAMLRSKLSDCRSSRRTFDMAMKFNLWKRPQRRIASGSNHCVRYG